MRDRNCQRAAGVTLTIMLSVAVLVPKAASTPATASSGDACGRTWVGAWAGPDKQGDAGSLTDQTFRMVVRTYLPGQRLRIRLTNALSSQPVTIDRATVGLSDGGAAVRSGTLAELAFSGQHKVTIPAHARIWSDPLRYSLPPDKDLAISLFSEGSTGPLTGHTTSPALADRPPSFQATGEVRTSYLTAAGSGDHTTELSSEAFTQSMPTEMLVDAVDVVPDIPTGAVVVLGDSISDGTNSTQDADRSWPDFLARRMLGEHPSRAMSVLNMGIAGNAMTADGSGPSAVNRLDRDVLQQSGIRAVILFEGINDLGLPTDPAVVQRMRTAVSTIVERVHAAGLPIFAGLLTPTGDLTNPGLYSSPTVNTWRHQHNDWLRTPGLFDGVIDFDAAVRNPDAPEQWAPGLSDQGEWVSDEPTAHNVKIFGSAATVLVEERGDRVRGFDPVWWTPVRRLEVLPRLVAVLQFELHGADLAERGVPTSSVGPVLDPGPDSPVAVPDFGESEELASDICFLASDASRYITGQPLIVDGGFQGHQPGSPKRTSSTGTLG